MTPIMHKNSARLVALLLLSLPAVTSCVHKPDVVEHEGQRYRIETRAAETFVYFEYHWGGGSFQDAVDMEERLIHWADEQGVLDYAIGRFPEPKDWQIGFVASSIPETMAFEGQALQVLDIPAGRYAVLETHGNADYMFLYWHRFEKWLVQDGHEVDGPVFETYPDILGQRSKTDGGVTGYLRYRLGDAS